MRNIIRSIHKTAYYYGDKIKADKLNCHYYKYLLHNTKLITNQNISQSTDYYNLKLAVH
jgi:hypothetical protein